MRAIAPREPLRYANAVTALGTRARPRAVCIASIIFAAAARRAEAQQFRPALDPALLDPVFEQAIRDSPGEHTVRVSMEFSSMEFSSMELSDGRSNQRAENVLKLEITRDHTGVYRLVEDLAVVLRAQCPVVPSWASMVEPRGIARSVACRVVYGEPVAEVAERAAQVLRSHGRAVNAADIARDLSRIPAEARLSRALIVPIANWTGGAGVDPLWFSAPDAIAPRSAGSAACRAFRSRWPISGNEWDNDERVVSTRPAWDSAGASARCWGSRGEWALGIRDRSFLRTLEWSSGYGPEVIYRHALYAMLAHWDRRGARQTRRIDSFGRETLAMLGAIDLDGDGNSEALIERGGGERSWIEIYTVQHGQISPWTNGPHYAQTVGDANNDGVLEVFAEHPLPQPVAGEHDTPLLELWQRVPGHSFSNRTALSRAFVAQQCPTMPRSLVSGPHTSRVTMVNQALCARLHGLSAEETVYRLCSTPERVCDTGAGARAVQAAREDVPYWL